MRAPDPRLKMHLLDVRALKLFGRVKTRCGKTPRKPIDGFGVPLAHWDGAVFLKPEDIRKQGDPCRLCHRLFRDDHGDTELAQYFIENVPEVSEVGDCNILKDVGS